jgi:translation initiation factor IF-1
VDTDGTGNPGSGAQVDGTVIEPLPSRLYRVRIDGGIELTAHVTGRMDRNFIRLLVGDRVRIELSPVDSRKGRIVEKLT